MIRHFKTTRRGYNGCLIQINDLVEPAPCCMGLFGKVEKIAAMHGSVWLYIQRHWLPSRKYRQYQGV